MKTKPTSKKMKNENATVEKPQQDVLEKASDQVNNDAFASKDSKFPAQFPAPLRPTKTIKGLWSAEEDKMLLSLIDIYSPSRWVEISHQLRTRTAKQCRERYHQNLRPNLNKSPISVEEGDIIKNLVAQHGFRWTLIAKLLNTNRSDNSIKNWWKTNVKKKQRNVFRDSSLSETMVKDFDMMAGPEINSHNRHHRNTSRPRIPNRQHSDRDPYSSSNSNSPTSDCSSPSVNQMPGQTAYIPPVDQYGQRHPLHPHPSFTHTMPMGPTIMRPPILPQDMQNGNRGLHLQPFMHAYPPQYSPISHVPMFSPTGVNPPVEHLSHSDPNRNDGTSNSVNNPQVRCCIDGSTEVPHHLYAAGPQNMGPYIGQNVQHLHLMQAQPLAQHMGPVPVNIEETRATQPILLRHAPVPVLQQQQQQQQQQSNMDHQISRTEIADSNFNASSPIISAHSQSTPAYSTEFSPVSQKRPEQVKAISTSTITSSHSSESSSNKLPSFEELTNKMNLNNNPPSNNFN